MLPTIAPPSVQSWRSLAASTLAGIPDESVGRLLTAGLGDPDPAYRCLVPGVPGMRRGRSVAGNVAAAMDDKDAAVYAAAIEALAAWPDSSVERDPVFAAAGERVPANQASLVGGILRMVEFSSPSRPIPEIHAVHMQAIKTRQAPASTEPWAITP